jgi:hypothetical protein
MGAEDVGSAVRALLGSDVDGNGPPVSSFFSIRRLVLLGGFSSDDMGGGGSMTGFLAAEMTKPRSSSANLCNAILSFALALAEREAVAMSQRQSPALRSSRL